MALDNPTALPGLPLGSVLCEFCKHLSHLSERGWTCKAFPSGIPNGIETYLFDQRNPFAGDNGILFELSEDVNELPDEVNELFATLNALDSQQDESKLYQ